MNGRTAAGHAGLLLAAALLASGCASDYVARTRGVRAAYEMYDHDGALARLEKEKDAEIDRLLYLLDKGMLLHAAGRSAESNAVLEEAERLAAQLDIVSVSEEARVLLANERKRAYRGEDFEKLLVNVLKALNYAQLGEDDDALVEVRRVHERMLKMVREEKKPYEQLAVARYLGAVLYEDQGELDSAYIDYREALRLCDRGLGSLAGPLLRLANTTGRGEELEALRAGHEGLDERPLGPNEGEVVVVLERGLSPQKQPFEVHVPGATVLAVPAYRSRFWDRRPPRVRIGEREADAELLTSIEQVAQTHLAERMNRLVAKNAAGTAVKAGLASSVGAATGSRELGYLAFVVLSANNEPDLRSWLSLPAEFRVARLRLPAGRHEVVVEGRTERRLEVDVRPRRIRLVVVRQYD